MPVMMYVRLVLVVLLASSSQAIISSEKINADAAEMTHLNQELKSSSPAIFHRSQLLVCKMIDQCCPFTRPHLAEYVGNPFTGSSDLMRACIGNSSSSSAFDKCPILKKFMPIAMDKDFQKYSSTLLKVMLEIQNPTIHAPLMCSEDEAYAILCNWTKLQEIESCYRKMLDYVSQHHNDSVYQIFVEGNTKNLRQSIIEMKKAFPMVNTAEIMASSTKMNTKAIPLRTSSTVASSNSPQRTIWTILTSINLLFVVIAFRM